MKDISNIHIISGYLSSVNGGKNSESFTGSMDIQIDVEGPPVVER